jgi:group I intron endonuclease
MNTGIYLIEINEQQYVGSTATSFNARFKKHMSDLIANRHGNIIMQRLYNKYQNIKFSILEECEPDIVLQREQYFIDTLNPSINICKKAGNSMGRMVSDETRQKIREKLKGKPLSCETIRKLSLVRKGRVLTEEHKNKLSKSMIGRNGRRVVDISTGIIYDTIKSCCISLRIPYSSLKDALARRIRNKTTIRYADE